MIYALNICGHRDLELSEMMHRTLKEHCKDLEMFERRNLDNLGWAWFERYTKEFAELAK